MKHANPNNTPIDIYFLLTPDVHLLDLAGPCQAFHEAISYGMALNLHFISDQNSLNSHQGLTLGGIQPLPSVLPHNAIVVVCASKYHEEIYRNQASERCIEWLRHTPKADTRILGICTGAFLLGLAGWLDNRQSTTHHKLTKALSRYFPAAKVLPERIFVQDGQVYTTAGVTAGIDLALQLIEEISGSRFAMEVARELVVYRRRMANDPQISKQLSYRSHISPLVHSIQDYLQARLHEKLALADIADAFRVSSRHMQREFKNATGLTIREFLVELRLEEAKCYIENGDTIEVAALKSGFPQASSLRAAWKKKYKTLPKGSAAKVDAAAESTGRYLFNRSTG
ncbi:GlxA family transcriptional regulator [Photobacterium halotolerans]|uniref:Helix-turn-helix domain-containing protein n=1 Tax=Photobacterium halotolerans TaxID=265726 RepID=A0A7X4WRB8_9GAMM|nr:helix-turn-helix domain-containing protein [Photobacterium halotolerans]NAW65013.1 helix-turn-helix domain-containing protein [Photobacterium halotolerans]NAW86671.1 helix-turn-helix domain-containing protein [Photobacterium halotolerans]NAX46264.1 helix-turn-helix domain-containing protein [Photobacterium halotolerans]